jgi:hypothetical protein
LSALNSNLKTQNSKRATHQGHYCNLCGRAMPPGVRSEVRLPGADGTPQRWTVCESCRQTWLRCASCGRALGTRNESFLLVPEARRFYCERCWSRPRCDTCGLPLGAVSYVRPDGRRMCDRCHLTAIYDPAQAQALYERVQRTVHEVLGLTVAIPPHFHLVNHDQLLELADHHSASMLENDARQRCFGLFLRDRHLRAIYVEYGLPQIVFCEVVAHEYAHVWQGENCPLLNDARVREGFAEWVAYKVLEYWGCTRRLAHFRQRTDLYGQGLQLMLRWEAAGGVSGVLERAQATR